MALIVVPLSSTLLWLGWRAVGQMEKRDVEQGMSALDDAVVGFLGKRVAHHRPGRTRRWARRRLSRRRRSALPRATSVCASSPRCCAGTRRSTRPSSAAPTDGCSTAGRTDSFSPAQRGRNSTSRPAIRSCCVSSKATARRGAMSGASWVPTANPEAPHTQPSDFDPRRRSGGYRNRAEPHAGAHRPYRFAWSGGAGVSVGVPMPNQWGHRLRCLARHAQPADRPVPADRQFDHPGRDRHVRHLHRDAALRFERRHLPAGRRAVRAVRRTATEAAGAYRARRAGRRARLRGR